MDSLGGFPPEKNHCRTGKPSNSQKHLLHHAEDHLTVVPVSFCPRLCKNQVGATCHVIPEESGTVHGHLFWCGIRSEKLETMNLSNEIYVVHCFLFYLRNHEI